MPTFKLTFNKPAVRQFIEGEETGGLRIKLDNGVVQFMPSTTSGPDTTPLTQRTRGGYEAIIEGDSADSVLEALHNPNGPFFVLKRVSKDWVAAEPYNGKDAPPKFEPHVRVWAPGLPKAVAKIKKPRATKAVARTNDPIIVQQPSDPMDRVHWAYEMLSEAARPGRPSKELVEARAIRASFEDAALNFMSKTEIGHLSRPNLKIVVETYNRIGDFLRTKPEVLADKGRAKMPKARGKDKTPRRNKVNGGEHHAHA
jgi:hypothetical protein